MTSCSTISIEVTRILGRIFRAEFEPGVYTIEFGRDVFDAEAKRSGLLLCGTCYDLSDFVCYDGLFVSSQRSVLPSCVRRSEPKGWQWRLHKISRFSYAFRLEPIDGIHPSRSSLLEVKIPDATPEIITSNSLSDEQALLARVRYNRLIDIFLGITTYSLQNHLRTTVKDLGQIEIDEVYVGIDRYGCQFIIPVQAKGGSDQLSTVQAKQDIACCAGKFPHLVCRAISAQFMDKSRIAMFELRQEADGLVRIVDEKHYVLVPSDQIDDNDLVSYRRNCS